MLLPGAGREYLRFVKLDWLGGNNGEPSPRLASSLSGLFLLRLLSPLQARSRQSYQGLGVNRPSQITDVRK